MINSDSIHEMLMQDYQLQSLSEPSSATPSLQRHPHYNSTWVPEDYSTKTMKRTTHKIWRLPRLNKYRKKQNQLNQVLKLLDTFVSGQEYALNFYNILKWNYSKFPRWHFLKVEIKIQ